MGSYNTKSIKYLILNSMNSFHKFIRFFSFLEGLLPKTIRLPFRYYTQKAIFALDSEFKILDQLVVKGKNAIDIGANKGIYTYYLSKNVKHVYCFEPLLECCKYIDNYSANNISIYNCALSNETGIFELYVPIINKRLVYTRSSLKQPTGSFNKSIIKVKTLDMYKLENIGFIKIDVEGVEMSVLEGSIKTITNCKPNLLIEIDMHQHSSKTFINVFNYLYKLGYKSYLLKDGKLVTCIGSEESDGLTCYNFIFIHPITN